LGAIDPAELDAAGRVRLVQAWERQHAWISAQQQAALVDVAGIEPATPDDFAREEVATALGLSGRSAANRLRTARMLLDTLPGTYAALGAGQLSVWHALAMVEECGPLDRATAEQVETAVLPGAPGLTLAAFRRRLRRAILKAQPAQADRAHEIAKTERAVRLVPEADEMASLIATLPALDARAVFLAVDTLARARHQAAGGSKSDPGVDARRADALIALADAALADRSLPKAHGRRVELQVVIDLPTLLGLADNPAELPGYGPLPAAVARDLAADATWRRLVTDPVTGHLLDYGHTTYRAPQPLADYLTTRDRHCTFYGCHQPAIHADLDHAIPYTQPGGHTSAANLVPLCRRHHRLKTKGRWKLRLNNDTSITWRTPAGLEHHIKPRSQLDE
jgi:hypothetical protein